MARLFVSFRHNAASEHYLVAVVLDAPASGVVVVLLPPPPVAAGFLSQPVVNAARPQRTSNVQIFFINNSFLRTVGEICFAGTFPYPFYLKTSSGANLSRFTGSDSELTVTPESLARSARGGG
jgi:hypothetical protein